MKSLSLKDKIAYYAKVRGANYTESLRLEGFDAPVKRSIKDTPTASLGKKSRRSP